MRFNLSLSQWRQFSLAVLSLLLVTVTPVAAAPLAPTDTVVTNCTNDAQLSNAVAAAGTTTITFNCGAGPHTIPISTYMPVAGALIIDGGDQITLDGGGVTAFFQVFTAHSLDLRNITLQNGKFTGIHPLENFGNLSLTHVTLQNNQTIGQGGAVANSSTLVVRNSTFTSNVAVSTNTLAGTGGAIYLADGTATIENSNFTSNRVQGAFGTGGAIAVQNGKATLTGNTFRNNSALDGGALYVNSSTAVTVTTSTFTENSAGYGGAIENRGQLHVNYSTFTQNKATTGDGGAIWGLESDLDMAYSTVSNNQAATTGGGISCYANSLSVIHSTISDNQSGDNGGGIYSTCNLNVTNTTLSGNKAPGKGGGAIYQAGNGSGSIAAATIAGNTATFGAGVYNDGASSSTLSLHYTILTGNTTGNCDGVITSLGYNLTNDNSCGALTQAGDQKNATLPLGPLAANGGPTLTQLPLAGNVAIDAIPAAQCSFTTDQRDVTRPQNGNCDSGAVEIVAVKLVYLPIVVK